MPERGPCSFGRGVEEGPLGFGGVGTPQLERESGPRGFRVLLFAMQLRKKRDERTLAGGS